MQRRLILRIIFKRIIRNNSGCWVWKGPYIRNLPVLPKAKGRTSVKISARSFLSGTSSRSKWLPVCGNSKCVKPSHMLRFNTMEALKLRFQKGYRIMDGHWLWQRTHADGYGYLYWKREKKAHRISWLIHHGKLPPTKFVLHKCDIRNCVNPAHLFLGNNADNKADEVRKGRQAKGETHGNAKLALSEIQAIRKSTAAQRLLATQYQVSESAISLIKNGKRWN